MQEQISDIRLRFGSEYPSLGSPPMGGNEACRVNGRVTSGRIFRSEPQHMTDIILSFQVEFKTRSILAPYFCYNVLSERLCISLVNVCVYMLIKIINASDNDSILSRVLSKCFSFSEIMNSQLTTCNFFFWFYIVLQQVMKVDELSILFFFHLCFLYVSGILVQ
jgi:hypothetical protein